MPPENYFTISRLVGLPGLPGTVQGVLDRAKREAWPHRQRVGRGGGREYAASALPPETRAALAASFAAALTTDAARSGRHEARKLKLTAALTGEATLNRRLSGLKNSLHRPVNDQRRIDARLAIVSAFEQFHRAAGLALRVSRPDFARRYNAAEIAVEPWVRELVPVVSDASLWRWQRGIKQHGISHLAGAYGNRRGDALIDRNPDLQEFVISMLVEFPHTTCANILKGVAARFKDTAPPSARALQNWIGKWKRANAQTFTALTNPDAWKGKHMVAFGSQSADVARLNQRWELDSTPGDIMLTDGRHTVIGVIDVYSRRARLLVAKTSKATAIATLLRHALLDWGVPDVAKTDNGADYTSHLVRRVFASLDIHHELCPPFQPWHKPHIERFFGSFSHGLLELLPDFIGHNVAERKDIEARKSFADRLMRRGQVLEVTMTAAEFQSFCDKWCEDLYYHQQHKGLDGKSPFEIVAANRDAIRAITDPRALDILLAEAPGNNGRRTVQKKGIELDRAWFIAPELGAHVGEDVFVRHDPLDLGRIYVFDAEEGFVCVAECPERTGMDRRVVAARAREIQKANVQDEKARLRATAKRVNTDDVVNEILTDRAQRAGKLAHLPAARTEHVTGGLIESARAAHARRASEPAPLSAEDAERLREIEAALAAPAPVPASRRKVVAIDDPEVNYRRWCALRDRLAAGGVLTTDETEWHVSYQGSAEWRAMERMAKNFPETQQRQA